MALKSPTGKILLKIMTTRSLIANIRSKNALIPKMVTAENLMMKGPAIKISLTERTTANNLAIKNLTIKRPTQKKLTAKSTTVNSFSKKSDTEESCMKILVKKSESENRQSEKLSAKISAVNNPKKINCIELFSNSEIPNNNKTVRK